MKKTTVVLSALLLTAPVFATISHTTDETVAAAHVNADTAREELHQTQDQGEELKLNARQAAEGEHDTLTSKASEDAQEAWYKAKEGANTLERKISE